MRKSEKRAIVATDVLTRPDVMSDVVSRACCASCPMARRCRDHHPCTLAVKPLIRKSGVQGAGAQEREPGRRGGPYPYHTYEYRYYKCEYSYYTYKYPCHAYEYPFYTYEYRHYTYKYRCYTYEYRYYTYDVCYHPYEHRQYTYEYPFYTCE